MKAHLYCPTKTAMQSGKARTREWVLEFIPLVPNYKEPLMGWVGMRDTCQQIKLYFPTLEQAKQYADQHKISYEILKPKIAIVKPKRYSDNFSVKSL
jgi:hypothetical protein